MDEYTTIHYQYNIENLYNSEKIVLKVNFEKELYELHFKLLELSYRFHLTLKIINDGGKTSLFENSSMVVYQLAKVG